MVVSLPRWGVGPGTSGILKNYLKRRFEADPAPAPPTTDFFSKISTETGFSPKTLLKTTEDRFSTLKLDFAQKPYWWWAGRGRRKNDEEEEEEEEERQKPYCCAPAVVLWWLASAASQPEKSHVLEKIVGISSTEVAFFYY